MSLRSKLKALIPRILTCVAYEVRRDDALIQPACDLDLRIDQVTLDNVARIGDFRSPLVVDEYRKNLIQGDVGVYAFSGGLAIGHAWAAICKHGRRWIGGVICANADTACIHRCNVNPDFRGHKVYQNMLVELVRRVFDTHDVRRVTINADVVNSPSVVAIERIGFRRLYSVMILRWCGRTFRLRKNATPATPR